MVSVAEASQGNVAEAFQPRRCPWTSARFSAGCSLRHPTRGQPNRLWATQHALDHAGDRVSGAVLASDAFFPFAREDAVEAACKAGVTAIIQPGGGARDEEAVEVCDEYGVAMVFSGTRAFRH